MGSDWTRVQWQTMGPPPLRFPRSSDIYSQTIIFGGESTGCAHRAAQDGTRGCAGSGDTACAVLFAPRTGNGSRNQKK